MTFEGVEAVLGRFQRMAAAADAGALKIITRSQTAFEAAVIRYFTQEHPPGTPTPSAPGNAPAVVTGTLRRSFVRSKPAPKGLGTYVGSVFPTSVYARIQELGGETGRNHDTTLPARPYMAPTLARIGPSLAVIQREEFAKVLM